MKDVACSRKELGKVLSFVPMCSAQISLKCFSDVEFSKGYLEGVLFASSKCLERDKTTSIPMTCCCKMFYVLLLCGK